MAKYTSEQIGFSVFTCMILALGTHPVIHLQFLTRSRFDTSYGIRYSFSKLLNVSPNRVIPAREIMISYKVLIDTLGIEPRIEFCYYQLVELGAL